MEKCHTTFKFSGPKGRAADLIVNCLEKMTFNSKTALQLLDDLNAPDHLKTHVALVSEAAELLIEKYLQVGVSVETEFIRIGVLLHDIGKILCPNEMFESGSNHEIEGRNLLIKHGVDQKLARVCLSHARWQEMDCSIEELTIALSDKLWKGKRVEDLEMLVIERIASFLEKDLWSVFSEIDERFEFIAFDGPERLKRSISS